MTVIEKAYAFAKEKHKGQFRRDGVTPYFTHCEKVASLVDSDFEKAVAYCHDLIEDGKSNIKEIEDYFNDVKIADVVSNLSRNKNESYSSFIQRLKNCSMDVIRIKIADIVSNLSDNPSQKQIEKYNKALRDLANV